MEGKVEKIPEYISGRSWKLDRVQKRYYKERPLYGHPWKGEDLAKWGVGEDVQVEGAACWKARVCESSLLKNWRHSVQPVCNVSHGGWHASMVTNHPFCRVQNELENTILNAV